MCTDMIIFSLNDIVLGLEWIVKVTVTRGEQLFYILLITYNNIYYNTV